MSQEELAAKVDTKGNVIGLLESGERGLSDKWLRKLAPALQTRPGFLLEFDPNDVDPLYLEAVVDVPKDRREDVQQVIRIIRGQPA